MVQDATILWLASRRFPELCFLASSCTVAVPPRSAWVQHPGLPPFLVACSVNLDGATDVIVGGVGSSSRPQLLWCESDGAGPVPSFTPHVLLDGANVHGFDVLATPAGLDVVVHVSSTLMWYRSTPGHPMQLMSSNLVPASDLWRVTQVMALGIANFDGLGNWACVAADSGDAGVTWFTKVSDSPATFTSTSVATGTDIFDMSVADVDQDGLVDIIVVSGNTQSFLRVYWNQGGEPPTFWAQDVSVLGSDYVFLAEYVCVNRTY